MAVDYIRREVEGMSWPEILPDSEGDMRREIKELKREVRFWKLYALILFVSLTLVGFGALAALRS